MQDFPASLSWEDPLEEGMATHSSILAWRIPLDRGAWGATFHGVAKGGTGLSDFHSLLLEVPVKAVDLDAKMSGYHLYKISQCFTEQNHSDLFSFRKVFPPRFHLLSDTLW